MLRCLCNEDPTLLYEPRSEKTGLPGFRPGPIQAKAVQSHKMVRGLKFRI